jgi:hypothetical protein
MGPYVKRSHMRLELHPSCGLHHGKECNAQHLERLERNERIERKSQHLERLDPKREVELEGTFTNHLADAIRASDPTERQQAVDKATEAYEDALDEVLYEMLDKRFAAGGSSEPTSSPDTYSGGG